MNDSVLVVVASGGAYLQHGKALAVNCKLQGNWKGDFAWICNPEDDMSSIESRGFDVLRFPEKRCAMKFRLFDPYFKKWNRLIFFDCDSLVQGDLNVACDRLSARFPAILCDGSQDNSILSDWEHFDRLGGTGPDSHPEVYERLKAKWPSVTQPLFGSNAFCFDPRSIPHGTLESILSVQEEFKEANPGGYDQQVTSLVLYDQLERAGKDFFIWWAFDVPHNRVPSESRGWRGDEFPVAVHYWSCFAPWLEKPDDNASRVNERLGRVCRDLYLENLAAFNTMFPRVT